MVYKGELCVECLFMTSIFILVQAGDPCKWVNDSQPLLLEYFDTIHNSPSQIYNLAILLSPSSSWLHSCYNSELPQKIKVVRGLPTEWGECSRTVALSASPWTFVCWKNIIAAGCHTGDIVILDGITGSQRAILSGHTQGPRSLTFSLCGTLLVSGSEDMTVKLWDVQTGGLVKTFHGHTDKVLSVSISADSSIIVSGSCDKTIRLWEVQTMQCHCVIEQQETVHHVDFSPMGSQHLISMSGGKVWQWDISGHQIDPAHHGSPVTFSLDQIQIVLCQGVAVMVQHFDDRQLCNCCCLFPGGRLIAFAAGSTINVWDITHSDPHLIKTFVGHTKHISSLAFSSPSSLISSSYDESVKFWQISDLLTGPVVTLPTPTPPTSAPIRSVTLQVKDGMAISSNSNGVVGIWDISTGHCKAFFQTPAKYHHMGAGQVVDGRLVFVWFVEEEIHIWDAEQGEHHIVAAAWGDIEGIRISGDGYKVFCLRWESIHAWSILTGEVMGEVELKYSSPQRSLTVDGSKVWVYSPIEEPQGWDFEIPSSPPVQLPITATPYPNGTTPWRDNLPEIKDTATGKVVFRLGGRFMKPVDPQWDGQYLVAGYESGTLLDDITPRSRQVQCFQFISYR